MTTFRDPDLGRAAPGGRQVGVLGRPGSDVPAHLLLGPPRHGVRLLASQLADELGACLALTWEAAAQHPRVHLHVNGALVQHAAADPLEAMRWLARRTRVTLTLHDLPQPRDGASFGPRTELYRGLLQVVDGWAVSSRHEEQLVHDHLEPARDGLIAPLPVLPAPVSEVAPRPVLPAALPLVGVLGFVYPGKGHREAIAAAARLRGDIGLGVVALGSTASGHGRLEADLRRHAARRGVPFHVTGHLRAEELTAWIHHVDVPLCGHRKVSASGSTNSWIGGRRRPLVRAGRYAREMESLRPGTSLLYDPHDLPAVLLRALVRPSTTWLDPTVDTRPHLADVAECYRRWWDER